MKFTVQARVVVVFLSAFPASCFNSDVDDILAYAHHTFNLVAYFSIFTFLLAHFVIDSTHLVHSVLDKVSKSVIVEPIECRS